MIFGKNTDKVFAEIKQLEQNIALARGVCTFALLPVALSDGRWVWLEDYVTFTRIFYDAAGLTIGGREITADDLDRYSEGPEIMRYAAKEMYNLWYERVIYKKSFDLMTGRLDELENFKKYKGGMLI